MTSGALQEQSFQRPQRTPESLVPWRTQSTAQWEEQKSSSCVVPGTQRKWEGALQACTGPAPACVTHQEEARLSGEGLGFSPR